MTFHNVWDLSEDEEVPEVTMEDTMEDTMQDSMQVTMQVEQLIQNMQGELTRNELQEVIKIKNRNYFRKAYINVALNAELIVMTIPTNPIADYKNTALPTKV
jgi:ATP-dependent DNA helicase RecG